MIGGSIRLTDPSDGAQDGISVIALDGDDGAMRWSKTLASSGRDDRVDGIAVGPDTENATAIYVYGELARSTVIDGQTNPAGAYLLRYDESGTRRWAQSFPRLDPGATAHSRPIRSAGP